MRRFLVAAGLTLAAAAAVPAQFTPRPPLTPAETLLESNLIRAIEGEVSGDQAREQARRLAALNAAPAAGGGHRAIRYLAERAAAAGLADVRVDTFDADARTFRGTLPATDLGEVVSAAIPGAEADAGEIGFVCRLDHERPGANDNPSGCATVLEVARAFKALIDGHGMPRPARTLRFIWTTDPSATAAYLIAHGGPRGRMRAAVSIGQVGAGLAARSVLHLTRSPWSAASIADEVAAVFLEHAVRASDAADPLWADVTPFEGTGDNHALLQEGAFGVPTVYLHDGPARLVRSEAEAAALDAVTLDRVAGVAASTAYFLATVPNAGTEALLSHLAVGAHARIAEDARRAVSLMGLAQRPSADALNIVAHGIEREQRRFRSLIAFMPQPVDETLLSRIADMETSVTGVWASLALTSAPYTRPADRIRGRGGEDRRVPARVASVRGPLGPGNGWVAAKGGAEAGRLSILKLASSAAAAYEAVNFIDGARSISDIRDAVSAETGNVPLPALVEYFELLARAGAITIGEARASNP